MGTILVAVDGSPASIRAAEFAGTFAAQTGSGVMLAHVIPWSPFSFTVAGENEHRHAQKKQEIEAAHQQVIAPAQSVLSDAGCPVEALVRHGDPVDLILEFAEQHGATHIIAGRTGRRLKRAMFGSTSSHLVQVAQIPVTVVP